MSKIVDLFKKVRRKWRLFVVMHTFWATVILFGIYALSLFVGVWVGVSPTVTVSLWVGWYIGGWSFNRKRLFSYKVEAGAGEAVARQLLLELNSRDPKLAVVVLDAIKRHEWQLQDPQP